MISNVPPERQRGCTRERIEHDPRELALACVRRFGSSRRAIEAIGGISARRFCEWLRGEPMSAPIVRHVRRLLGRE